MARTISGPKPGTIKKFIPKSFGNEADNTPVTIHCRVPSEGDRREVGTRGEVLTMKISEDGTPELDQNKNPKWIISVDESLARQKRLVCAFVEKVENYSGRDGPILNGEGIVAHGDTEILIEVAEYLEIKLCLGDEELKKSEGLPACSLSETQPSDGLASSAQPMGCENCETVKGDSNPCESCRDSGHCSTNALSPGCQETPENA